MRKIYLLAMCAVAMVAYAENEPHGNWTGYYMLARGRDLAGLTILSPDLDKTVIEHL